jgi:tetratricopeptide (TPR) repeat protein
MPRTIRPTLRRPRRVTIFVLTAAVALVSCSNDPGASAQTDQANEVLSDALEAHAAGDLDEAVELYEEVLVLDPQNRFAYYNLGLIDQTRGLVDEAAQKYEQALAVAPGFTAAMFNLAIIRAGQGAIDEAIGLYREVIEINADDARAHLNLGFLLIQSGERTQGEDELAVAVELDPSLASRIPEGELVQGDTTGP